MGDDDCFESASVFGSGAGAGAGLGGTMVHLPLDEDDYLLPSAGPPADSPPAYMELLRDPPPGELRVPAARPTLQQGSTGPAASEQGQSRGSRAVEGLSGVSRRVRIERIRARKNRGTERGQTVLLHRLMATGTE